MVVTESLECVKAAAKALYNKKGIRVIAIDLRDISAICDFMVIAEGGANRHVVALAQEVMRDLKTDFHLSPAHKEGVSEGEWVALDYTDFMVHILTPALRDYYRIEGIWPNAKLIELDIEQD